MQYLSEYLSYLEREKHMSDNSVEAYKRDIINFGNFLNDRGILRADEVSNADVVSYMLGLKKAGKSASTANRKLSSIRAYFSFLQKKGLVKLNPTNNIKSPRIEHKDIEFLSLEEVDRLLSLPDESPKGIRDRAILELMYATGIRARELVEANVSDLNMRIGFITCTGEHGKARIVPIGRPARAALESYLYEVRPELLKGNDESDALFVNYAGERLSRQGLWKILKEYADKAGIESKITPQTLRNTFAAHMAQNGADLKSLQELMGHEDISATQVYYTLTKNRIKDVYDNAHPRA